MKKALSLVFASAALLLAAATSVHAQNGYLRIHMISAGDGRSDCFLVELPGGGRAVIDVADGYYNALVNKMNALGIPSIAYVIGTHEHVDHIGGLDTFVNNGYVNNSQIWYPKGSINAASSHYDNLVSACNSKGLSITKIKAGDYILNTTYSGKAVKIRCLSPDNSKVDGGSDDWGAPNEASLVLKITYGTKSILMQADTYGFNETAILSGPYASEINLCQVLKVGHHGRSAPGGVISCSEAYLDAAGVNKALITDGDLAIDDTIKARLQARNIRYWSSGTGDGYAWLRTDGATIWEEGESPTWP